MRKISSELCSPLKRSIVSNDSVCGQRRPWSDCVIADWSGSSLSHIPEDTFSHEAAHVIATELYIDIYFTFKPGHSIFYKKSACSPSADSDHPAHPRRLISLRRLGSLTTHIRIALRRLWSDCADAQADLSLRWAYMQCYRNFCTPALFKIAHILCKLVLIFIVVMIIRFSPWVILWSIRKNSNYWSYWKRVTRRSEITLVKLFTCFGKVFQLQTIFILS